MAKGRIDRRQRNAQPEMKITYAIYVANPATVWLIFEEDQNPKAVAALRYERKEYRELAVLTSDGWRNLQGDFSAP